MEGLRIALAYMQLPLAMLHPTDTAPAANILVQVGGLIKRLDTGEGSYAKELEEDYDVADQLDQVKRWDGL